MISSYLRNILDGWIQNNINILGIQKLNEIFLLIHFADTPKLRFSVYANQPVTDKLIEEIKIYLGANYLGADGTPLANRLRKIFKNVKEIKNK